MSISPLEFETLRTWIEARARVTVIMNDPYCSDKHREAMKAEMAEVERKARNILVGD